MRHAARKSFDSVHLLCLRELSFESQMLGQVAAVGDEVSNLSVGVTDGRNAFFNVVQVAVFLRLTRIPR